MGGVWRKVMMDGCTAVSENFSVALGDIWRSRDGSTWELVTNKAPWGTLESGNLIAAGGRFIWPKEAYAWFAGRWTRRTCRGLEHNG
jgi:hypothetical protein